MSDSPDTVELFCTVIDETEDSLLCDFGDEIPTWILKSVIDFDLSEVQEIGDEGEIVIMEWIAIEEGLV